MVVARTTCAVKLKMEGWILNGDGNKLIISSKYGA
jgi:hypothetical protein